MTEKSIPQVRPENQPIPATVNFHGHDLITIEKDGAYFVALKPICEGMGLDWASQYRTIRNDLVLNQVIVIMTMTCSGKDGKDYKTKTVCLPIGYLNGWLFKINASRYKGHRREMIIQYQKECYEVLFNYWNHGAAINPRKHSAPGIIRYQNFPPVFILDNALYTDTHHHYTYLQPGDPYDEWLDRYFRRYLTYHGYPLSPEQPDDPARIAYLIPFSQAKSVSRQHITYQGAESFKYFSKIEQDCIAAALDTGLKNAISDAFSARMVLPHA